jgi:serine O-acetyltransferase
MGQPTVGDAVVFLDGAKVMGPVTVGDGAVVAANALVLTDVPPGAIMVGQPARVVRHRSERTAHRSGTPDPVSEAENAVMSAVAAAAPADDRD